MKQSKGPTWPKWIAGLLAILAAAVVMLLARPSASQLVYSPDSAATATAPADTVLTLSRALIVAEGEIEKRDYRIEQLEKQVNELRPSGLRRAWNENKVPAAMIAAGCVGAGEGGDAAVITAVGILVLDAILP